MMGQSVPYRPRVLSLINRAGESLRGLGVGDGPLRVEGLIRAARERTGLSDFGDESFREPLSVLVRSIDAEAELHTVGRLITQIRLVGALCTRLRVADRLRREPSIQGVALAPPIVIAGLQRTGTTMLHRLLASDLHLRALRSWEAIAPVAPTRAFPFEINPRLLQARLSERALSYMAPEFFAIHPVEADAPEEDVLLLDYSFLSTVPEATLHVPSYARWLESQDHTPAYRYMATLLRLLSHQGGAGRWLLKTPHHLEHLDVLRKVFPGAQVIQTHRDPARTLASFCSMIWHGRGVFSDHVDPISVGKEWSRKTGRMLERSLFVRESARDVGFVDVSYYDLIDRPVDVVRQLYAELGLTFGEDTEARVVATREGNPQHKYGKHSYRLEDFGLTREGVEPLFATYRSRFGVRHES